jgi:hypothetical protein
MFVARLLLTGLELTFGAPSITVRHRHRRANKPNRFKQPTAPHHHPPKLSSPSHKNNRSKNGRLYLDLMEATENPHPQLSRSRSFYTNYVLAQPQQSQPQQRSEAADRDGALYTLLTKDNNSASQEKPTGGRQHRYNPERDEDKKYAYEMFTAGAGHQLDLNHLWQQVQELSAVLAANKESTVGLVRKADELRVTHPAAPGLAEEDPLTCDRTVAPPLLSPPTRRELTLMATTRPPPHPRRRESYS